MGRGFWWWTEYILFMLAAIAWMVFILRLANEWSPQ